MKQDFDEIIEMAVSTKDVNLFGRHVQSLKQKYNVVDKTIYTRFNSVYGCSPRELIRSKIEPSTPELEKIILASDTAMEVKEKLSLPNSSYRGIYDKHFGVSNFCKAKELILMRAPAKIRNSTTREDNISLMMSQHIGDGYYCKKRHALKVSHSMAQLEYLRWKVGLIHDGYNTISTKISIHTHKQGHQYCAWYSCKLGNIDFPLDKTEAVKKLTPIGWLLLYLDDGCYGQDIFISASDNDQAVAMQQELSTYGIESRVNIAAQGPSYNVTMCGGKNSIAFYKNFIEPYLDIIPECMLYKTKVKI